jgi:hypothetical protein
MRYTYIAAWSIIGGISLPNDLSEVELYRSENSRFILTREPNKYLGNTDRGFAIGSLMLCGVFGQAHSGDLNQSLNDALAQLQAERMKKLGSHTAMIFEATGDVETTVSKSSRELDDFIVTFDAVDKDVVRKKHRSDIQAMKLALSLEGRTSPKFAIVTNDVYLSDDRGKTIYSISFSMSAELSTSSWLTEDSTPRIASRYVALRKDRHLEQVQRLFSQMSDSKSDQLKSFISGWSALEILITKTFKTYEQEFLSPLKESGQLTLRERFLERLKSVMKDKYRLSDKFLIVSSMLFPDPADKSVEDDYKQFSRLKDLRDSIFHGDEFDEKSLPLADLKTLLLKFTLAHSVRI